MARQSAFGHACVHVSQVSCRNVPKKSHSPIESAEALRRHVPILQKRTCFPLHLPQHIIRSPNFTSTSDVRIQVCQEAEQGRPPSQKLGVDNKVVCQGSTDLRDQEAARSHPSCHGLSQGWPYVSHRRALASGGTMRCLRTVHLAFQCCYRLGRILQRPLQAPSLR